MEVRDELSGPLEVLAAPLRRLQAVPWRGAEVEADGETERDDQTQTYYVEADESGKKSRSCQNLSNFQLDTVEGALLQACLH